MKKLFITTALFGFLNNIFAQEVSLPPKFFTLRNARISGGIGFEAAWAKSNKGFLYRYTGSPKELNSTIDSAAYGDWNFGFDLYAPNSFLGFYIEANYGSWDIALYDSTSTESFVVRFWEIPFYLKLRPGKIESTNHLWLLLGASYLFPSGIDRKINQVEEHNASQTTKVISIIGTIGYEHFLGERSEVRATSPKGSWDRMRVVFFLRYIYTLNGRLKPEYYQTASENGVLKKYPGFDFKDQVITLGIKYFFRLGKFK